MRGSSQEQDWQPTWRTGAAWLGGLGGRPAVRVLWRAEASRRGHGRRQPLPPSAVRSAQGVRLRGRVWTGMRVRAGFFGLCSPDGRRAPLRVLPRLHEVVYHLAADKYRRLTRRLSQEQKGLEERALTVSQPSSHPCGCPRNRVLSQSCFSEILAVCKSLNF
jgi:hypothetical protein